VWGRQSPRNWDKTHQTLFHISIKPCFQPKKSYLKAQENDEGRMIRPWVELEKDQYERLKELEENTGKRVSRMIREAVSNFVSKRDYSIGIGASHLPRKTRENYRRGTNYLSRSDLSLLKSISKEMGRCKTDLIREAVDNYLGSTAVQGKRGRQSSNDDG